MLAYLDEYKFYKVFSYIMCEIFLIRKCVKLLYLYIKMDF